MLEPNLDRFSSTFIKDSQDTLYIPEEVDELADELEVLE